MLRGLAGCLVMRMKEDGRERWEEEAGELIGYGRIEDKDEISIHAVARVPS